MTYTASSWKIGGRSTEIHPITGQHAYDTGNLYRTVHWKDDAFGLNGYFTDALATAGMWRSPSCLGAGPGPQLLLRLGLRRLAL